MYMRHLRIFIDFEKLIKRINKIKYLNVILKQKKMLKHLLTMRITTLLHAA